MNAKTVTFGEGKTYTLDQYGFLDPPDQWDQQFADGMARLQGVYDVCCKRYGNHPRQKRSRLRPSNRKTGATAPEKSLGCTFIAGLAVVLDMPVLADATAMAPAAKCFAPVAGRGRYPT